MDLATLIEQLHHPPVSRVGVLDLETFLPIEGSLRARDAVQQPARVAEF